MTDPVIINAPLVTELPTLPTVSPEVYNQLVQTLISGEKGSAALATTIERMGTNTYEWVSNLVATYGQPATDFLFFYVRFLAILTVVKWAGFLLSIYVSYRLGKYFYSKGEECKWNDDTGWIFGLGLTGIFGFICGIATFATLPVWHFVGIFYPQLLLFHLAIQRAFGG